MNGIGCLIKTIIAIIIVSLIAATVLVVGFYAALGAALLLGAYRAYKYLTRTKIEKESYV